VTQAPEPPLSDEPDNEPDDSATYQETEYQDRAGHERPKQNRHSD
jgi:hypothetical protein